MLVIDLCASTIKYFPFISLQAEAWRIRCGEGPSKIRFGSSTVPYVLEVDVIDYLHRHIRTVVRAQGFFKNWSTWPNFEPCPWARQIGH